MGSFGAYSAAQSPVFHRRDVRCACAVETRSSWRVFDNRSNRFGSREVRTPKIPKRRTSKNSAFLGDSAVEAVFAAMQTAESRNRAEDQQELRAALCLGGEAVFTAQEPPRRRNALNQTERCAALRRSGAGGFHAIGSSLGESSLQRRGSGAAPLSGSFALKISEITPHESTETLEKPGQPVKTSRPG